MDKVNFRNGEINNLSVLSRKQKMILSDVKIMYDIAMNTKDKDYETYGTKIADNESLIKGEIVEAFGSYTMEQIQADSDVVRDDILARIQALYDSKFVYKVTFRDIIIQ